jgi:hypothetical protein
MKPEYGSVTEILRITSSGGRALVIVFIIVNLILSTATLGQVYLPFPTIAANVLVAIAAIVVSLPAAEPLPLTRSFGIVGVVAITTALVDWNIPPEASPTYSSWHLGANTLVLLFLGLRGRSGLAWLGFALMSAITIAWTVQTGSIHLVGLLPNQVGTLLVGTLFAVALRRTSKRITELHAEQAALASAESAARAAAEERSRQAAHLNTVARPSLERIAAGAPYSNEDRDSWLRLESSVRDSLRAPALNILKLTEAADNARARGVEVTLLDDSAGQVSSDHDRDMIADAIIEQLDEMSSGRLIGRVLPTGRGQLATIVVDDGSETRRMDVGQDD